MSELGHNGESDRISDSDQSGSSSRGGSQQQRHESETLETALQGDQECHPDRPGHTQIYDIGQTP